ncbi:hypothetical protein [Asaia sp. VD9]|uniref:hypothetical protein n=1 Tax=Asaia sp. VD9 TaxID=3081235 RepID=UPI00301802F5
MQTIQITAADVSLYHVAASQLNDATQWWRIAQLNGMTDPDFTWLPSPVPLQIPNIDPTQNSGVPGLAS